MPDEERHRDARDEKQDQIGFAEMAPLEAGRAQNFANDERGDDANQYEQREDIDKQRKPALRFEPRHRCPGTVVDAPHREKDGGKQNDESPEDQCVYQAWAQALEELALAGHDCGLRAYARRHVVEASHRLAAADQAVQESCPPREERERDQQRAREQDRVCAYMHQRRFRISAVMAGTISFRSPVTV